MRIPKNPRFYVPLFFIILVAFQSKNYVIESLKSIYYFKLKPAKEITGYIMALEKNESIQGGISFEYEIIYSVNEKRYAMKELLSPDSLFIPSDSSIVLRYSVLNPALATIKADKDIYKGFGISCVVVLFICFLAFKVYREYRNSSDARNTK